jgi:hypothetical protein
MLARTNELHRAWRGNKCPAVLVDFTEALLQDRPPALTNRETGMLFIIFIVAAASLLLNALFIAHELGWFPHGKDRSTPADRAFSFRSRYEQDMRASHAFQVMDRDTHLVRVFGHPEIYEFTDPYGALENVIRRYEADPTRSRYDDLIHLSNHICNRVRCDDRINALIGQIHALIHSRPIKGA